MRALRHLNATLALLTVGLLGVLVMGCGEGTIKLSVTPQSYKFIKAESKKFEIQVTGIGEVFISNVELIPETNFKFPGGVANCIGEPVGDNVKPCIETVELPTYKSGLSAELKVTVKNLQEKASLSS